MGRASRVREDAAGRLFVVVNGGVYRPEAGPWEAPIPQRNWGKGIRTSFQAGAEVQVAHVRQSAQCRVKSSSGVEPAVEEVWACHGYETKTPEKCWHSGG